MDGAIVLNANATKMNNARSRTRPRTCSRRSGGSAEETPCEEGGLASEWTRVTCSMG
jgi:hypothetical protein